MDDLSIIHECSKQYAQSAQGPEEQQKVLQLAKDNPEAYWSIAFSQYPELVKKLRLISSEHYANEALKEYHEVPQAILLKMTALQAWSWSKNDDNSVDEELLAVWKNVFKQTSFEDELKNVSEKLNLKIKL